MPFLHTLRRVLKILNSELTPNQVAVGFCLGILAGLVPWGWNTLFLLTLAFILNISFSTTLLAFALFKVLAWPLLPLSYAMGKFVLDEWVFLEPLWQLVFHGPLLAWMGLDHYAVFGGYLLALLIAAPSFLIVRSFVMKYRESFFAVIERSRPWKALGRRERLFRLLQWLLMGGGVRFHSAPKRIWLFRCVRKQALVVVPLAYLVVYGVIAILAPFVIDGVIARGATLVVGGEVSVARATANAFSGRLVLKRLSIQNPNRKGENVVEIREIVADLSMLDLASRRVVFDEIAIGEVFMNIRREADGSLNVDDLSEGIDLTPYFEWLRQHADNIDWLQLLSRYGEVIWRRIVSLLEPKPPPLEAGLLADFKMIPALRPTFAIEALRIERVHIRLEDQLKPDGKLPPITAVDVALEGFVWRPELGREPITLGVQAYFGGEEDSFVRFTATFDERGEIPTQTFYLEARNIDLTTWIALYEHTLPVSIVRGKATLMSEITIRGEELSSQNNLIIEGLALERAEVSLFGLDPATSSSVVEGINAYAQKCPIALGFSADGTVKSPRFHWDGALLEIAKRGLSMRGARQFSEPLRSIDAKLSHLKKMGLKTLEEWLKDQLKLPGSKECALSS